jgi:crossover junction endonuclease MUS81
MVPVVAPAAETTARKVAAAAAAAERPIKRPRKPRQPRQHVPTFHSGAYAIIVGLSEGDENDVGATLTKAGIIVAAQKHCDASFTAPSSMSRYHTAWNSIKTLLDKELVYVRGRPLRKYGLTDEGWDVAKRIRATVMFKEDNGEDVSGGGLGVLAEGSAAASSTAATTTPSITSMSTPAMTAASTPSLAASAVAALPRQPLR